MKGKLKLVVNDINRMYNTISKNEYLCIHFIYVLNIDFKLFFIAIIYFDLLLLACFAQCNYRNTWVWRYCGTSVKWIIKFVIVRKCCTCVIVDYLSVYRRIFVYLSVICLNINSSAVVFAGKRARGRAAWWNPERDITADDAVCELEMSTNWVNNQTRILITVNNT